MTTHERTTLTVAEVAAATGLSEAGLRKHIASGVIPSVKVGRRRLIPATWLRNLTTKGTTNAR